MRSPSAKASGWRSSSTTTTSSPIPRATRRSPSSSTTSPPACQWSSPAERARRCGSAAGARAREIVDRYRDLGTLETRLARVEATLVDAADNPLLGTPPTRGELRVLELLDGPRTLAEIADELYVSQHTVRSHAQRLYRRLGASTREAAVAAARERGLL
jgi:DNA-binding CsgD family transcriptional regulator